MNKKNLKEAGFSPKLMKILNNGKINGEFTPGELFFLSIYLPVSRQFELMPYIETMSFQGLLNLFYQSPEDPDYLEDVLLQMQKIAFGFDQKIELLNIVEFQSEEEAQKEFYSILDLTTSLEGCSMIMEYAEEPDEINAVIQKIKTFNPSIHYWLSLHDEVYSPGIKIAIVDEMFKLAFIKDNLSEEQTIEFVKNNMITNWLFVYDNCLHGSEKHKLASKEIDNHGFDFKDWYDIYNGPYQYETKRLAFKKMQELKGTSDYWYSLLCDYDSLTCEEIKICLSMIYEIGGNLDQYNDLYHILKDLPGIQSIQISLMQKMMSILDNQSA